VTEDREQDGRAGGTGGETDGIDETGRGGGWRFDGWVGRRARGYPDALAAVAAESGEEWTYAELDRRVATTAGRLRGLGIGAGDHLGTLAGTRMETLVLVHAAGRVGAVLVPLNPRSPPEGIATRLDRADVTGLICTADTGDDALAAVEAAGDRPPVAALDDPGTDRIRALGAVDPPAESASYRWAPGDPQLILFTSGTTGDPKPVVVTAGSVFFSAVGSAFRLGVSPGDRWFCELPAYHMGGIAPFYRSALYGTAVVVQERDDGFDPDRTVRNCREHGATGISLVPTQLAAMLEATDGRIAQSLRVVLLGGGPAPEDLIARAIDRGIPVHPTYGMTETASQIATARPTEARENPGTVGPALAVTDLRVVDGEGDPLPAGEVGEFVVDGPTVTPGYYRDRAATDEAFGEYGLHTSDLGYLDDAGRAHVVGRRADRIVTGGENVSPAAVRDALTGIDGVEDAAVVGLEDPKWGERVAALVVRSDPGLPADLIDDALAGELADFERPRTVVFAEELPRTASGTIDRPEVRERIREASAE